MKFVDLGDLVMVALNWSWWKWSVNVKKLTKDSCQIDWLYKKNLWRAYDPSISVVITFLPNCPVLW